MNHLLADILQRVIKETKITLAGSRESVLAISERVNRKTQTLRLHWRAAVVRHQMEAEYVRVGHLLCNTLTGVSHGGARPETPRDNVRGHRTPCRPPWTADRSVPLAVSCTDTGSRLSADLISTFLQPEVRRNGRSRLGLDRHGRAGHRSVVFQLPTPPSASNMTLPWTIPSTCPAAAGMRAGRG